MTYPAADLDQWLTRRLRLTCPRLQPRLVAVLSTHTNHRVSVFYRRIYDPAT
jgi:hypothetical protein